LAGLEKGTTVQPTARPTRLPRALRPLADRDYRMLMLSVAASLLGSGTWVVAIVWQVMRVGGGPAELSLVTTGTSVGMVLSVLAGGVAADRLPKRTLLLAVETVRVLAVGATGLLALSDRLGIWQLTVLAFLVGAAEGFFHPAYTSLLPALLPADELLAANGVDGTLRPLTQTGAGPALAGVLIAAYSPATAMLAAAACYALALVALVAMRGGTTRPVTSGDPVLRDLREGFGYMFRTAWFLATMAFATIYVLLLLGPIEVLLPFAARDQTGAGPAGFSLVLAAFGIGGAIGSVVTASLPLPRRYLTAMMLIWGLGALPLAVIGLTDRLWVMVAATFTVGYAMEAGTVIWGTLLQRRVPARLLGRVSSVDLFVSIALMPASMALAGPVGERLSVPVTFVVVAVIPVLLAGIALVVWRLPADEIAHPLDERVGDLVTEAAGPLREP
jgi:MFS family permease